MGHSAIATAVNGDGTGTGNGSAEVEVELEVMRKHDFSWHPCIISLSSTGVGLVVEYLENGSSELIVKKEEALERIRIRSIPLKDDDCTLIKQGDHVLAKKRVRRDTLLLDATVDKHSKKAHPRCTFVVKWIHGQVEGETATVSCTSIWNVSRKSISFHPTIIAFFNTLGSSGCFSIPPNPTVAEEMESEIDTKALGMQREKMSNWQRYCLTRMPGLTESNSPQKMGYFEVKPLPNPLAARAALASMIAKLNCDREALSVQQEAEEFKPSTVTNGNTPNNISAANSFSKAHDHSLHTKSGKQKHATIMKELFPNGEAAKEAQNINSPCASWNKREMEEEPREYSNVSVSRQSKSRKDNLTPPNGARRLTRSAVGKPKDKQAAEIKIHSESSELDGKQASEPKTIGKQKKDIPAGREIVVSCLQAEKEYKTSSNVVQENVSSGCVKSNTEENSRAVTAKGLKKGKVTASIGTPKLGDDATCSTEGRQGTKRKSATLKKQEQRFSPRLRLLAETSSQNTS